MKSSPTPPDPYQTAAAQTQSNLATAKATQENNMVNQSNPYGSLTYSQTGTNPDGTPIYSASTTLSPAQQQLLDQSNANKSAAGSVANQYLTSGQGAFSGKGPDLSYNGTTAALDALNRSRLDPQWQQNQDQLQSQLAAQGLNPGSVAYDNAFRNFSTAKNDAYNSANLADYQTSANAALQQWNAPLQAYGALYGSSQPTGFTPMNTPTTNVPGTNVAGLVEQNYQQQSQNANAANGQLAGLIGTGLGIAAAPLTGGTSLLGAGAGALGGLFGMNSPTYGGGNVFNSANGGSSSNPLGGLTAADYGVGY